MAFLLFGLHIDWILLLKAVATVGIPTALVLYSVKRMQALAGPHVELEPQHLVNIVLAFPTTDFSLQSLEMLVRGADFRSPETRRVELRKLQNWLADRSVLGGDGFSLVLRRPAERPGPQAERLANVQIKRMEAPQNYEDAPETAEEAVWCVIGLVAALAVSAVDTIPEGDSAEIASQAQDALKAAAEATVAMDAFYLFYAPAPKQRLGEEAARRLIANLRTLATPKQP